MTILDAGCGTGVLGLSLLRRFSDARLIATDLEPNFLRETMNRARRRGLEGRVQVGIADISHPQTYKTLENQVHTLEKQSLQLICTGAVLGYSANAEQTLTQFVDLLAPGGTLINLEMNDSLAGKFVSHRYHYRNIPLVRMIDVLNQCGCKVIHRRLGIYHWPVQFTRTAIIATKPK